MPKRSYVRRWAIWSARRDEWTHLTQVAPDYIPARANLAILNDSHIPPPASTPTGLNRLAVAR